MAQPNGMRKTIMAFLSGGAVALLIAFITAVFALGGERRAVLDHVASTEPLRHQAAEHIADREAHLSSEEAVALARVPAQMDELLRRMTRIESKLDGR